MIIIGLSNEWDDYKKDKQFKREIKPWFDEEESNKIYNHINYFFRDTLMMYG